MTIHELILELQDIERLAGELAQVRVRDNDDGLTDISAATFQGGSQVEIETKVGWSC